jgi:acetolactate synthase regulatory subunit
MSQVFWVFHGWGLSSFSCSLRSRHPSCLLYEVPHQCQSNCQCDNFEPQEVRLIKLLRMVRYRGWKISFFLHTQLASANKVRVHNVVRCVSVTVLLYGEFHSFTLLIAEITLQWCRMHVHQYVYIVCVLPHYGCQVILVFVTPLPFNSMSKILQHPFSIWSNSPAAFYCLST